MKKAVYWLLVLTMVFALCACALEEMPQTKPSTSVSTSSVSVSSSSVSVSASSTTQTVQPPTSTGTTVTTVPVTSTAPTTSVAPTMPETSSVPTAPTTHTSTAPTVPATSTTSTPTMPAPTVCTHSFSAATCTAPKTCTKCGATEGSATGHSWKSATCTEPKTCTKCGTTSGSPKGHNWKEATCSAPMTCSRCQATQGSKIDHIWETKLTQEPTPTTDGILTHTCYVCGYSYEENIGKSSFDPNTYGDPHHIRTSGNPDHYVDFSISGNMLRISGKIVKKDLQSIGFFCGSIKKFVSVKSGEPFYQEISLSQVQEKTFVEIYTNVTGETMYWSYIYNTITVSPQSNGYRFDAPLVLEHNIAQEKQWCNPQDYLSGEISQELKNLSNSIVGSENNTYKKMYMLNQWVAENIYYDYDFLEGKGSTFYSADDVYHNKRAVCGGYANLLIALLRAQGIPAMKVVTYSALYLDESNYQTTVSNHAHVEAYLESEGRWVTMDPTWDSRNEYKSGVFIKDQFTCVYFDMSLEMFSYTHKIMYRG